MTDMTEIEGMGPNGLGYRVLSPHKEGVERLSPNGNKGIYGKPGEKVVISKIGTAITFEEAKQLADELNNQLKKESKGLERLIPWRFRKHAEVVEDKPNI